MKKYSIGFMTYVHRYESHFLPLYKEICRQRPDIEKLVFLNGQHKEAFNQNFRRKSLQDLSNFDNTYVHMSPTFRSFSHMVNTNVNLSTNENTLILSDDVSVGPSFLDEYESSLEHQPGSFLLNGTYAHFSLYRDDVKTVGYFDERLLGMGEEDGDWDFRYCRTHNIPNLVSMGVPYEQNNQIHHQDERGYGTNENIRNHNGKHSSYNQELIIKRIREYDEFVDGDYVREGPYGRPVQMIDDVPDYYQGQIYFWENGDKL